MYYVIVDEKIEKYADTKKDADKYIAEELLLNPYSEVIVAKQVRAGFVEKRIRWDDEEAE